VLHEERRHEERHRWRSAPADELDVTADAQAEESEGATPVEGEEVTPEASDGTEDDAPSEYYGVDLSGLSSEERATIVAGFQERDKFIQQLLRNKVEEPEPEPAPSTDDELTDADLLKALGLDDPDDAYAESTAKVALPLAKMVLSLQEEVTGLKQRTDVAATEQYWNQGLAALEDQFGKLPVSHDEVLKLSAEAGVSEPVDAYWRIMGPARQQVMAEVQKRREALVKPIKDGTKGSQRPSATADTSAAIIEAKDVKDAMRQALASLQKERGISLVED
jgi:hypothetical protein